MAETHNQAHRSEIDYGNRLVACHVKAIQEFLEGISAAQVVEERLHRNPCSPETGLAVHAPGIDRNIGR